MKEKILMNFPGLKISKSGQMKWHGADVSWSLNFRKDKASLTQLDASEMKRFTQISSSDAIICKWTGHPAMGDRFEVTVFWKNEDGLLSGTIEWKGGNRNETIEKLCFPVVTMPWPKEGRIFNSYGQGGLFEIDKLPTESGLMFEGTSVSITMQYTALISSASSYYFDTRDTMFHSKSYEFHSLEDKSKIRYLGLLPLPLDGKSCLRYKSPYTSSMGFFKGGWFEAAQIYRKWALQQKWAKRPPVDRRLKEIGIWAWNRGLAEDVIKPVEKLQKDAGVPVALDWYWWHQNPYDTSYPFYWPPREGLASFKKAMGRLKKQGVFTQVYLNGLTWDMDAEHWKKGGRQSVVIDAKGEMKAYMFNAFAQRRLAWMCGKDNMPFRKVIGDTVKNLRKAGLSGVYLDMIGCASTQTCYNESHSHTPGGGNYTVQGYREMVKNIRKENPGFPLSTEEPSEAYMDLFDSNISLSGGNERLGGNGYEPIPAFSAVYHGLTAMFGNYALPDSIPPFDPKWPKKAEWKEEKKWHELYPDQFFAEVARSVVWGLQPTVANLRHKHTVEPEFKEIYEFLVRTARFYHSHRDFLFDGEMLNPGRLATKKIEVDFLQRFIFTPEGKQTVLRKKMPAILHSLWRAKDGRLGLLLANYSQNLQNFNFESSELKSSGKIPARSWLMIELSENNAKKGK
ncbi:MAG: hypothetical protein A2X49_13830 [Lentisphaerae bacterium GWF2_52_8]|nr:MAG: hypothetical protein A2X49_13830 [Lentisphaerae bacterium GWF2_52_8]